MTDPIGQNSYKGLAVPLFGESVIQQQNSSNVALTLMHSTLNTGRFLMGLDYKELDVDPTSVLTDLAVFDIDTDGGYRTVSGTTMKYELDSSGLFKGTTKIITSSGEIPNYFLKPVVDVTTGADYSPVSSQSGHIFNCGINDGTSQQILLPKNPPAGTWYEFYVSSQDETEDFSISCTANSSAKIILPGMTSVASTCDCITPVSSIYKSYIRLVALSSIRWFAWPSVGYATADVTTGMEIENLSAGHWTTGSTAG